MVQIVAALASQASASLDEPSEAELDSVVLGAAGEMGLKSVLL
jgi:hypothetical protein